MIAAMREREYPAFMDFHMRQGLPQQQAHDMWGEYEQRRLRALGLT